MRFTQTATRSICLLLMLLAIQTSLLAESSWPYADETAAQRDGRMAWWRQARFGMFIHWGVYSVPAGTYNGKEISGIGEWIMLRGKIPVSEYKAYAKRFNPVKYDPDSWVRLAKEAGMKYIVITSKHHDGFALFDSAVTDWDVVDATPYGKDLLKPLAEACRKHGIKLGFYYSQAQDWNHPGGAASGGKKWDPAQEGSMDEYIKKIAVPQVKEILTNYGDIAVLWWDTPRDMNEERADLLQPLINLQPGIITNNRLGGGYQGDCSTPEQHIPATGLDSDWEACMTMNHTWGFKSYDHDWKSTETLIRNLVDIASKGGNYLLNVGPTSEGEIPQPSIERLKAIGQWMKVYGSSIYETTASPFAQLVWGRCTKKTFINGATLYLHVFDWPGDGKLVVPGLKNEVKQAFLMGNSEKLRTSTDKKGVTVYLPGKRLDAIDTVVVLKVSGDLDIEKNLPTQNAKGTVELGAKWVYIHNRGYGEHAKVETKNGKQNIGYWTDSRAWVEWPFVIRKEGRFTIKVEVALEAKESGFEVIVNGKSIKAEVESTGDLGKFKTVTLGQTDLLEPGEHSIQIKPNRRQWKPINLRSITLEPIRVGAYGDSGSENWPTWRGPNMMGIRSEGNPPVKWSESENIKWKVKLTGDGSNSSPIIWKNKIFFQTAVDTNKKGKDAPKKEEDSEGGGRRRFGGKKPTNIFKFNVVCLDRKTGKLVWEKTVNEIFPHEGHHDDHGFASSSPVTDGKLIWANFGSRGLHCLDMDGNLKWSKELGKMSTPMSFGEGSSPVLVGDAVIVVFDHQGDSYIAAFNKTTGDLLWKKDRDEVTSWATPIPVKVNGKMQVVVSATDLIRSYDVKTGDIIWQCGGQTRNVIPSPVTGFGMIYCTSGFRGNALQAIELGRTGDLTDTDAIKWHVEEATPYVPSPLLYGEKLYVCSGNSGVISCYNAKTGKPYFVKEKLKEIKGVYASPVGAAGRIYFVGRNGVSYVVNSSDKFEVLSVNKLDAKINCSPAFFGDEIYLKGKQYLYCIAKLK